MPINARNLLQINLQGNNMYLVSLQIQGTNAVTFRAMGSVHNTAFATQVFGQNENPIQLFSRTTQSSGFTVGDELTIWGFRNNFAITPAQRVFGGNENIVLFATNHIPVTDLTLNRASATLTIGETETLIATVLPENATNRNVLWNSNNPTVATVNANGLDTHLSEEINQEIKQSIDSESIVFSDKSSSYVDIADFVELHITEKSDKQTTAETLKWVHIAIGNAKRNLLGNYHKIKRKYLQLYLNEFVYKLNRRYFGERIFDRLVIANITGKNKYE